MRPLQTFLRGSILALGSGESGRAHKLAGQVLDDPEFFAQDPRIVVQLRKITSESMKLAYVAVTTVPILLVYPFVQRFFIKGVLIGSIKE